MSKLSYPSLSPAAPSRAPCCWESWWWPRAGGRVAQTCVTPVAGGWWVTHPQ